MEKKKKNKKIIIIVTIVVGAILLIAGVIGVISKVSKSMQEAMEMMAGEDDGLYEVAREDVKQEISASGIVVGVENDAYISPVTAKVKDIYVEVGQTVKKGDILLAYDESELGESLEKVKIQAASERAMGNESYEMANEAATKVSEAKKKSEALETEIETVKSEIETLTGKIAELEEKMAADNETSDKTEDETADGTEDGTADESTEDTIIEEPVDEKEYEQAVADLNAKNEELLSLEASLAEQESIIAANADVKVSESTKAQINATNQLTTMNINDAQDSLDAAKAGLVAAKAGIVSSVDVVKGAYASETQTVMTIIDSNKIGVEFTIPKDDIGSISKGQKVRVVISGHEYSGTVDFVSRVAGGGLMSETGGTDIGGSVKGRVLIDNPDENIFIGVSAKVFVFVGEEKQTLVIPYEALNMDIEGDFVYVVNDENLIERKTVKVGIYSDEYFQVLEGLSEGDKVIKEVTLDMKPGDEYMGAAMPDMAMPE